MDPALQIIDWNKDLVDIYDREVDLLKQDSPNFINQMREKGIEQFKKLAGSFNNSEYGKYLQKVISHVSKDIWS